MPDQPPYARYRLVCTRSDGSVVTVLGAMTLDEAMSAQVAVSNAHIFDKVDIALDSEKMPPNVPSKE